MSEPDNRQRILDAAMTLFARQGYGSTSVREVVESAGVTKPTLYYYFDSKEALFREVVASKMSEGEAIFERAFASPGPVVPRLRDAFRAMIDGALADPDGLRLMLTCSLPDQHGHPEVDVIGRHMRNMAPLQAMVVEGQARGEFRAGVDPHVAVMVLLGAVNLQFFGILQGVPVEVDVIDALLDTWLRGVSP